MEATEATSGPEAPSPRGRSNSSLGLRPAPRNVADAEAARRLLARRAAALGRIADPRRRRAQAYQLLVRAGFEADLAADLARAVVAEDVDEAGDVEDTIELADPAGETIVDELGDPPDHVTHVPNRQADSSDRPA